MQAKTSGYERTTWDGLGQGMIACSHLDLYLYVDMNFMFLFLIHCVVIQFSPLPFYALNFKRNITNLFTH